MGKACVDDVKAVKVAALGGIRHDRSQVRNTCHRRHSLHGLLIKDSRCVRVSRARTFRDHATLTLPYGLPRKEKTLTFRGIGAH